MKNALMLRIISLFLAVSFILGCFSFSTAKAYVLVDKSVKQSEPEKQIFTKIVGDIRIQVLSPTLVRAEVKGQKGFEDRKTFHIVNRTDWEGDIVTESEDNNFVYLSSSKANITVQKGSKDLSGVKITDKNGKLLWKFEGLPENKISLPEANKDVYAFAIADTPRIVPADWEFNPQPDTNTENTNTNGWDLTNNADDMYIFLPENNHRQLRKDFVSLTGKTEMLPLYALGVWDSRYYEYSAQTALQQIDDYHNRNLPLDVLVIDTDWRNSTNGMGYDVNTSLFPNMTQFIEQAHQKNVSLIFNDHPEPTQTNGVDNNILSANEITYRMTNLLKILRMGVDAWWYDRNWAKTIKPISGFTHEVMGMALYANAQKTAYPNKRLFMLSNVDGIKNGFPTNPSNIAAHRYSIQWTGDTGGRQETLMHEIHTTVNYGETNLLPYVSTDLGAHNTQTDTLSDGEYIRWTQMGALSPIFRPHVTKAGSRTGRMPWLKGENVVNIYRDYVNLRYRLLPVFYQLSNENYNTGMPILRSMRFDYPNYKNADRDDQYLLGEDILVAPVINDSEEHSVPESWFDGEITAEYYNNQNLSGSPVLTQNVTSINNDWGDNAPAASVNTDNFSIRYSGRIKVPNNKEITLIVRSDDGCRLYIDDEKVIDSWRAQEETPIKSSISLEGGKTYSFVLEYQEQAGKAICKLNYEDNGSTSLTRTVWIPEGEWINTMSGETVYGPKTISVSAAINQMPIFIKKGSVIPLADNMLTTKEKDWSHLTLDVYPSTRQSDITTLYEDDTESNDYQNGKFRTTLFTTGFSGNKATLSIGAAQGTFDGERAFSNRSWTIRVHRPEGFGELQKAYLGSEEIEFTKIDQDASAMLLNNTGGATDGDVYQINFTSSVTTPRELSFEFANPTEPQIPDDNYDTPFDRAPSNDLTDARILKSVDITSSMPSSVNLTTEGETDWLFASDGGYPIKKDTNISSIQATYALNSLPFYDYYTKFSFNDGKNAPSVTNSTKGLHSSEKAACYKFKVKSSSVPQELTLYIGAWQSTGKLEITDESGESPTISYNVVASGGSTYRKVKINFASETPANLIIKYTKTQDSGNITFTAATLKNNAAYDMQVLNVSEKIRSLPDKNKVTKNDFELIKEAYDTYYALNSEKQNLISKSEYDKLNNAVTAYKTLFTVEESNMPASGTYNSKLSLNLTAPSQHDMYYTMDGSNPTTSETKVKIPAGTSVTLSIEKTTQISCVIQTPFGYGEVKTSLYTINKNGWYNESGKWYYYVNNAKQTSKWIDDYYVNASGAREYNKWVGNYYVGKDGKKVKNKWVGNYYVGKDGKKVKNKWIGNYYVGKDGKKVKNKWVGNYYVGKDGKKVKNKWVGNYYVGKDGKKVKNKWIGNYYVGKDGKKAKNKLVKKGNKLYYCGKDGKIVKNKSVTVGNKIYKFNKSGVCIKISRKK